MIDTKTIKQSAVKWQTTELNVAREYCQHLFLSNFYQNEDAEKILFKGGTALRLIYGSPRFSEDLDFSSSYLLGIKKIELLMEKTLAKIESIAINVGFDEAKKTSGGYFAIINFSIVDYKIKVVLEISLRRKQLKGETVLINSELLPSYSLELLEEKELVKEKIQALLERQKPRDYFDLYFILRSNLLSIENKKLIKQNQEKIINPKINFKKELEMFLPQSYKRMIKNFPKILNQELSRQI